MIFSIFGQALRVSQFKGHYGTDSLGEKTKESHTGINLMRKKVKNEVKLKKKTTTTTTKFV